MTVGSGALTFEAVPGWPDIPADIGFSEAVGVAVDSRDQVFVFARADLPVLVFTPDGKFLRGWGRGQFVRPHGITIGPDDTVYLVDDQGHSVRQFSGDGELLRTIGPAGVPSDTGVVGFDYRTIRCGAAPFNLPTNVVLGAGGELFVTDGYGNARLHRFDPQGTLLQSWGEPGTAAGQFQVVHGIGSDGERLYVCDRENSRIQIFSTTGDLLAMWTDVVRPCEAFVARDGLVYVAELGRRAGLFPWQLNERAWPGGRVSIFDRDGRLLSRWGGGTNPSSPEDVYSPHDIQVDAAGNVYVAEVKTTAATTVGDDTSHLPSLRKFVRRRA
jgi:DNA-binding beta-propeller fold protein YncE